MKALETARPGGDAPSPSSGPISRAPSLSGSPLTRREALRGLGLGLLAVALSDPLPALARPLSPLGLQLYTVRDAMADDLEETLARVAAIGYREVEFAGYFGRTPRTLRAALDAAGLAAPSAHVGIEVFDDLPRAIDAARTMGHRWLVVPSLPREATATLDDWRRTAERFDRAGEALRAAGLRLAFHNHDRELRPLEGRIPLELFLEETDPDLVELQADLYWLVHGGADPVDFLARWTGRVSTVHVKGRAADGTMVDVGAGDVDWPAVLGAARRAGVRHWYVEHDRPADPFASVRASFEYLDALALR